MLCWCLLSYSLELNLFAVPGTEGKFSFLHLFVAPFSDIFFASSCRIGRFVSGAFQGRRGWKYKVFRKNTTQRCGDFFENRRLDLLFPKPAAIPLHLHDNGWCQKERPCGGKKIRAANENRNFTEVFGLHDYSILISEKWIQLRLTNVLKNGNRIQKWHIHQRNSDERRVWLVHASCIGFSPRLCSQAWKWSLRFTSMTSFLRWSMQTKWYGKSRNGVSFDRLACNRQKEALFLMPYYWDMKGWRATVSCRLDCAIKNGTASCGYKSQPLSARQTKKSPWQYSLEAFQGIPPRIFLAVP